MINNHKKGVMVGVIVAICLVTILGVTFAIWNYSRTLDNQILVAGDIYMKYTGTNQINAKDMLPIDINTYYGGYTVDSNMTEEELSSCESYFGSQSGIDFQEGETAKAFCNGTGTWHNDSFQTNLDEGYLDYYLEELKKLNIIKQDTSKIKENIPYFEFTIEGVNNYSKSIWYEIDLQHGEKPTGEENKDRTERIKDSLLRFRLIEVVGEEEQEIFTNRGYEDLTNEKIYVNTINANTKEKITKTYRLYMWISNTTRIGVGDNIDYDMETWNNKVYASIKVNVAGDFNEKDVNYIQPAYCFATQEFDNNGKTEIMITDYDTDCGTDVVIPSKINGHEVTVIGSNDKDNNESYIRPMTFSENDWSMSFWVKKLTSVVIPNTVRIIGGRAFMINNLTQIEIPDSVEWINEMAFGGNINLKEIIIGDGIQYIGLLDTGGSGIGAGSLQKIQIKKTCEEIKNIEYSPSDDTKTYPFIHGTGDPNGLDIYGYEDGAYKLCEHFDRNDF